MSLVPLTLATRRPDRPAVEIRVNFGLFAAREATPAELEALGQELLEIVPELAIVGEQRHFMTPESEAALYQVRIDIPADALSDETETERMIGRLLQECEHWARGCIADRSLAVSDIPSR